MYRKQVRRRRAALAILVISSFALLTATYGDESGALQRGVGAIFGPLQEGADRALKPARDLVNWFDETFDARGENDRLRDEVRRLRRQVVAGQTAIAENAKLRGLVGLAKAGGLPGTPVTSRVIGRSPTVWFSSVTIDRGTSSGIRLNDPVVNEDGLVGRVTSATSGSAKVTLITDHSSAVTAKVVPIGVEGVIRPEVGNPEDLVLDFIDSDKPIPEGLQVITAGVRSGELGSFFPYGLSIGFVKESSLEEQEASRQVHVRPYADMRELEFVQVLTR